MARYNYGVEKRIYLHDLTEQEVDDAVAELVNQADEVNSAIPGQWTSSKAIAPVLCNLSI